MDGRVPKYSKTGHVCWEETAKSEIKEPLVVYFYYLEFDTPMSYHIGSIMTKTTPALNSTTVTLVCLSA